MRSFHTPLARGATRWRSPRPHRPSAPPIQYLSGASTQTSSSAVLPTVPLLPGVTGFSRRFVQANSSSSAQTNGAESASASASLATGALRVSTAFASNGTTGGQTWPVRSSGTASPSPARAARRTYGTGRTSRSTSTCRACMRRTSRRRSAGRSFFDFSIVTLLIYQPGTLDDANLPFCNGGGTTNVVTSFFWSLGDNANATNPCGGAFLDNLSGTVNQTVSATFAPTGDFAWALGIRAIGTTTDGQSGPISWSYQFGNTVEYDFVAPADAVVTTASGIAPGGQSGQVLTAGDGMAACRRVARPGAQARDERSGARDHRLSTGAITTGARALTGSARHGVTHATV